MRAKLLVTVMRRNPEYNRRVNLDRVKQGLPQIPHMIEAKSGDIVDHPDCWRLCMGPEPLAAPADAECANRVLQELNSPARKVELEKIRTMHAMRKDLTTQESRDYVDGLYGTYADEINGHSPVREFAERVKAEANTEPEKSTNAN